MSEALLSHLLALEEQVWAALEAGDAEADARLLSADFLGVYPTGFSGRDGHAGQLDSGPSVAWHRILEPRAMDLAPDVALLAYRADFARTKDGPAETMYVSSIWRETQQGWVNVFSQDTLPGGPVP